MPYFGPLPDRTSNKGETIEIWGDPERLLETIYVKDFLQIIEKCVESPLDGGIYNAGSGGSTLKERIQGIVEVFSPKEHPSPIIYCPEKKSSQQFVLDIRKTMEQLKYTPQYNWKEYLLDFKKIWRFSHSKSCGAKAKTTLNNYSQRK